MNPNANEWKPSFGAPPELQPPPAVQPQESVVSDVDESDPLWQAVMKITQGDKEKALNMINDPDQLVEYPEILKLLEQNDTTMEQDTAVEEATQSMTEMKVAAGASEEDTAKDDAAMDDDDAPDEDAPRKEMKEGDPREHLNLVFIGHVDAGKSTLSGNLLYLTDNVDKRTIEKYEKEAKERNRESWFLAFVMDIDDDERAKGKTVEVGKAHFETEAKRYTILDAPGHKNYVPNMIQGACQADIAVLVISARKGEFEAGFDRGGQSREHALLAKTLGVSYLIVAINKMDEPTVKWSKQRYDEIVVNIRPYLKSVGFTIKKEVKFIPISGLNGANIKDEVDPSACSWWKESYSKGENNTEVGTLMGLLDSLVMKERDASAPLRIPVLDRYSDRGTIAMGKVESGVIRPGMKVTVMPTRLKYKVDEVYANEDPVSGARPGENVLVKLNGAKTEDIRRGFVICGDPPCRAVDKIIVQVVVLDLPDSQKVMTAGFQCMFHAHTAEEECTVLKIFETTNRKGVTVKDARFVNVGMSAVLMLELGQTLPLETFDEYSFLGRFTLRTEGKSIAIGKVKKLPPKKE